jgi:hypothetical protein
MGQHWEQPGPRTRGNRILVLVALVVVTVVVAIATISLIYTWLVAPAAV